MDATIPPSAHEPRRRQGAGFRLLPNIKFITWLFSVATRVVLLTILLGVFGFLALFAYFLVGRTWSMPVVLSAGHERVIQVQREWLEKNLKLADLDSRAQAIRHQLLEAENRIEIARIAAAAETNAIRTEAWQNDLEIEVLENALARGADERRIASNLLLRIRRLPDPEENFEKGLVNRARFLTDILARTDLSLKLAALDATLGENGARLAALKRRRDSLRDAQVVMKGKLGERLSHRELEYVKIWYQATLELQTGADEVRSLRESLGRLETLHMELFSSLRPLADSPLLAAAREPAAVVFVPYGNAGTYKTGQPIYHCHLGLVVCSPAGTIVSLVDGEIMFPHPLFRRPIRGSYYSINLSLDNEAAQDSLLFSARPLLF
jgi:hypothetical protein